MIPEIHIKLAGIFMDRVKNFNLKPLGPQIRSKIFASPEHRPEIIIEELNLDTLLNFAEKNFMNLVPHRAFCHNKKFHEYERMRIF